MLGEHVSIVLFINLILYNKSSQPSTPGGSISTVSSSEASTNPLLKMFGKRTVSMQDTVDIFQLVLITISITLFI